VYAEAVPDYSGEQGFTSPIIDPELRGRFAVRDLDGDGEAEVLVLLHSSGAHCCSWSRVYRYDRPRSTYQPINHMWGNGSAEPKVRNLDHDGKPEFLSQDDRFAYDFDGYAGSVRPIQIWSYRHAKFRDVTRRYPRLVSDDARAIWQIYLRYREKESVRGILPAWAADEYMLGRRGVVDQAMNRMLGRGDLAAYNNSYDPTGRAYIKALKALLRRTGYIHN
jgi:hypothetical protein